MQFPKLVPVCLKSKTCSGSHGTRDKKPYYNTRNEDNKDLQPAKRRELPSTNNALVLLDVPIAVNNNDYYLLQTSRSLPITVELVLVAEY
jgi:hypothetical protein